MKSKIYQCKYCGYFIDTNGVCKWCYNKVKNEKQNFPYYITINGGYINFHINKELMARKTLHNILYANKIHYYKQYLNNQ